VELVSAGHPDESGEGEAIHLWHQDVGEDDVGMKITERLEGTASASGRNTVR
jgi:hypothetical protein